MQPLIFTHVSFFSFLTLNGETDHSHINLSIQIESMFYFYIAIGDCIFWIDLGVNVDTNINLYKSEMISSVTIHDFITKEQNNQSMKYSETDILTCIRLAL